MAKRNLNELMGGVLNVNGKAAIRITGKLILKKDFSSILDCDGDREWFPNNSYRVNNDGTIDIQEWIFKQKFPNG